MKYNTAKLRQFINDKFDPQDLNDLLFDYFRPVHEDVTPGMTKRQQISLLLEYCHQHNQMVHLLSAVAEMRPFFQPDEYIKGKKEPTSAQQSTKTTTRNPHQIFISHAHQDAEVAQRLAHDLEAHGFAIWIAPDSIRPGEKWVEAINRGLEESGVFVLLLSQEAVDSRWVNMETNAAIEFESEGRIQFYPLMLKNCSLPPLWRAFQYISLLEGYELGVQALINVLDPVGTDLDTGFFIRDPKTRVIKQVASSVRNQNFIDQKTGKEFIHIPAGEFFYGDEKKKLYLGAFWVAKTPVTNAEYARFVAEMKVEPPKHWQGKMPPAELAEHPVVYVSWHDAKAYAEWAGFELPTEEQWEKAARGINGRTYPWGNDWYENRCNTRESDIGKTTPVTRFSNNGKSPFDCVDMSGNVWEWTESKRHSRSTRFVLRGGSWVYSRAEARAASRHFVLPDICTHDFGFRIVVSRF